MSGSNNNNLSNPAVSASGAVDTLLIEKFNGVVHGQYLKGESLINNFDVQEVTGTNMVSNKMIGTTELQKLTPGQEPEATKTSMDKNALVVDTMVLARNTVHTLHDIQSDVKTQTKIADNQTGQIRILEDQMIVQQLLTGGQTGGAFNPYAVGAKITGGVQRIAGHGVAINTELKNDGTQAADPYKLMSAIELSIMGLVVQRTPVQKMKVLVPVEEFGLLVDYGFVAETEGGSNESTGTAFNGLMGRLKGYNIPVMGSTEYSQLRMSGAHTGTDHHLLSNEDNGFRYDTNADMLASHAVVFSEDALLVGRTMNIEGDIFFDKKTKGYFIDSWLSEGAIPDRLDNIAIVQSTKATDNAAVNTKATGKAKLTRTS